ncbi:DUF1127 domain-containing protein [Yoonia sediminilitoris]|uniref:Uncharacterized protein DUF1127 n=1 Tax=Yoonia sediminilitoris TaxID=1286148 RepID=A0A2T6KEP5_9RHOB|nr:DUF1127 domain-containing protein [Yoonia sediminilitoris]PUB13595.1 uncharacterized protein DUF1127 [Yoonia sediminilitoris]RCW94765.1 uncharacterized protein DUF1127 [Yoonia sediminilitoris]
MAFITDTRVLGISLSDRIENVRTQWAEARAKRAVYKTTREELSVLSNRDLNDLGISRSQINNIAFEAAYGK